MEINLTYVFSAVIALGLINLAFIFSLKNKVLSMETKLQQQNKSDSQMLGNELINVQTDLNSNIKKLFETLTIAQNETILDFKSSLQSEFKGSKIQSQEQMKSIIKRWNELSDKSNSNLEQNNAALNKAVNKMALDLDSKLNDVNQAVKTTEKNIQKRFNESEKEQKTNAFSSKQEQLSNLAQLSSLVKTLRIENVIELTNELGKHNELKVETSDFIKHLGDCKVLKIEDIHSGQITQVYYENGIKRSTDTFAGKNLKYQMFYDATGKAQRGIELDSEGNTTFEYIYDDAGEISKRIEFSYDGTGKKSKQIEKTY
ncbi:hypothetical protein JK628_05790 [Shewanella sp. KX20019]|uniref:hypothetical protein n=1 Tax=Shewanella sp. KX20019 TaxID=2803864 RepID=UPI0019263737|nr:hypothetical protein [Shewanella sp. KX20019]QQX81375.1 hypothetical protein JK628_05790 [Shewanella sp. KX20019]